MPVGRIAARHDQPRLLATKEIDIDANVNLGAAIEVRPRLDADLPRCIGALRRSHEVDRYPMNWPGDPADWLSPPGFLGAWVATADRRLLGHVALVADGEDGAEVGRLFVIPDARGRGVAVALLGNATRCARAVGRRAELKVVEDSAAAIRLYERLGWTLLGRAPAPFTWSDGTRPVERRYAAPHLS